MNLNVGDTVFIKGIGWMTVTEVHQESEFGDYRGYNDEGVEYYFDEDDYE